MSGVGDLVGHRLGLGEDAHRLETGRQLVLGTVAIGESRRGAVAHSDGDVLLHAVSDALLSAFALGDIGDLFPPGEETTVGLASTVILETARARIAAQAGAFTVVNVVAVVTLDEPKLAGYRDEVRTRLAALLKIPAQRVGVTFKTSEGLAPDHVQARAMVLLAVGGG